MTALNIDETCKSVEAIFARGSGVELNKGEVGVFFKRFNERMASDKISTNTYELGTESYGNHQYPAVDVSKWWNGNALGAGVSSGYANDYGKSVDSGVGELYNYLTQRYDKCKSFGTKFVLGGYSQGAQVIGQTLPKFTAELRDSIVYAAFFGDPKLHLPEGEGFNPPACRGKELSAYRRVIANCDVDNGSLGSRKPYLPDDMKTKSGLWCYDHDFVCGVTYNFNDNEGHGQYSADGKAIDEAAVEIATKLKGVLAVNQAQAINARPDPAFRNAIDVVYVVDTTGSVGNNRLEQLKVHIKNAAGKGVLSSNGRVALVAYRDQGHDYTAKVVSDFTKDFTDFTNKLNSLSLAGSVPSDRDTPEAALHGLMTSFNQLSWNKSAPKAAMLITDDGYHSPDKVDGSTLASVTKRALEVGPISVFPIVPLRLQSDYMPLAVNTAGQVALDPGFTEAPLLEAAAKMKRGPSVILKNTQYRAEPNQEITFDASNSFATDASITKYDWDFDGNGTVEQSTTTPVANYTYTQVHDGIMQVRATASNNTAAIASATLKIGTYVPSPRPKVPSNVAATVTSTKNNVSTTKLTWSPSTQAPLNWVISSNGVVLGKVVSNQNSLEISDVQRSGDVELSVMAMALDGTLSDPATVTIKAAVVEAPLSWWEVLLASIRRLLASWGLVVGW